MTLSHFFIDRPIFATVLSIVIVVAGAIAYFILPADAIPDMLAGLGFTDDAAVLMMAVKTLSAHIRPEHVRRARAFLEEQA